MTRLHIHIGGSFADDARRILAAAARAESGEAMDVEEHVSFQDWETFFHTLTPARVAVLRHVHGHAVPSVRALAQALGRDYRRVHADVAALVAAGLLRREGTALTTGFDPGEADIEMPALV